MGNRNVDHLDDLPEQDDSEQQSYSNFSEENQHQLKDDALVHNDGGLSSYFGNAQEKKVEKLIIEEKRDCEIHYPSPVFLSVIVEDVSEWSGYNFVMDPSLNRKMQIFAPRKMTKKEGFQLFVASLEAIGLRALQMDGSIVKIVPMLFGKVVV